MENLIVLNKSNYMNYVNLTDCDLVHLMANNDSKAFENIYRKYWSMLYVFIYQQLGSKEDSEEIIHDLMLSIWQNRHKSDIQNLKIYLFIATRNLVNKTIKSQINLRKYREYQLIHDVFEMEESNDQMTAVEFSNRIDAIMKMMPEKTAMVFRMSKIEELPVKKIAQEMALSEKAIEYHITKSLKILRSNLKDFYSEN